MKTKTKEVVIKGLEFLDSYKQEGNIYHSYEIETHTPINLDALQHVITETEKIPERLDEWMDVNGVGKSEIVEFLNNNYKKQ